MTNDSSRRGMFAGTDQALFVAVFTRKLRSAGLEIPLSATRRSAAALELIGPRIHLSDLYWALRISLVERREDLALFDRVFDAVFSSEFTPRGENKRPSGASGSGDTEQKLRVETNASVITGAGLAWSSMPSVVEDEGDDDGDEEDDDETLLPELRPSAENPLVDRPFDLLDEAELIEAGQRLESAMQQWPTRRSRRRQPWSSGSSLDLRTTLRRSMRTGGEPVSFATTRPRHRLRRVVVLVDVSGSMESFARSYLHLTRALTVAGRAEVFAFGTELTRITPALKHRSPVEAIDLATAEVVDRFGGTRIAHNVSAFLRHPRWSGLARGAIVVIASDGWDADNPDDLAAAMTRLKRLAHRVVWVNPRMAAAEFEPRAGAFAAAMPHCDAVVSGHSVAAIDDLVSAIVA